LPISAINAGGQVTLTLGISELGCSGDTEAYLYSNGALTPLGTLGASSSVTAINSSGAAVGTSTAFNGQAVVFQDGVATTLNSLIDPSLHIDLTQAVGINDSGQIVANDGTGGGGACLLTPIGNSDTPEPASAPLLLTGWSSCRPDSIAEVR
jgi:probable HAF family extracellular repeat protein